MGKGIQVLWNYVKFKLKRPRISGTASNARAVSSKHKPIFEASQSQKFEEAEKDGKLDVKIPWGWVTLTTLVIVMSAHMLTAITSYLRLPVTTLVSIRETSEPFPWIAVCPNVPFDFQDLEKFNAVRPSCLVDIVQTMRTFLDNLPGVWRENGTNIQELWRTSAKNQSYYITREMRADPILTTNNVCYMLKPQGDEEKSLVILNPLSMFFFDQCFGETIDTLWIMFPEKGVRPVMIQRDQVYSYTFPYITVTGTVVTLSTLILDRVKPCQPLPYHRTSCLHQCHLEIASRTVGCSLPYINVTNVPACHTQDQYVDSVKYMVDTNTLTTPDTKSECNKRCPEECHTQYYHISGIEKSHETSDLTITYLPAVNLHIREYISQSFSSLFSELGGIVGLYVGWSMLDLSGILIKSLDFMSVTMAGGMGRPWKGVVKPAFYLMCLMVAGVLWTERIFKYVGDGHYYTHYGIQNLQPQHFPSLTVCRWPPFNLSRLVGLGLSYDPDTSCTYNGRFYRCFGGTEVLRDLPGVWEKKPIDEVWDASAWDLPDLVHSIQIDGREIPIT